VWGVRLGQGRFRPAATGTGWLTPRLPHKSAERVPKMRKRPQLREILPIYPAMPFPPLARFDRRSTIRAIEPEVSLAAAPAGTLSGN